MVIHELPLVVVHIDDAFYPLPQNVDALHLAVTAVRSGHLIASCRKTFVAVCVSVRLIFQTAHETSAAARYFGRVQGQVLFLGHLDGDRCELAQVCMAAERPSADPDPSEDLCLVTDTDLTQLDPRAEYARQILYQVAEVDAAVRCKVEKDLAVVKCIFRLDQLHLQTAFQDLLSADLIRFFFFDAVLGLPFNILRIRDAKDLPERLRDPVIRQHHRGQNDGSELDPPHGLDDDVIVIVNVQIFRVKIIDLAGISEFYSDYFLHSFLLNLF